MNGRQVKVLLRTCSCNRSRVRRHPVRPDAGDKTLRVLDQPRLYIYASALNDLDAFLRVCVRNIVDFSFDSNWSVSTAVLIKDQSSIPEWIDGELRGFLPSVLILFLIYDASEKTGNAKTTLNCWH